jgi:hypothetical protein
LIASFLFNSSHVAVVYSFLSIYYQNRIAEQEAEIKWLKKALDETNNVASKDQIDKLQHVIDVWQNQVSFFLLYFCCDCCLLNRIQLYGHPPPGTNSTPRTHCSFITSGGAQDLELVAVAKDCRIGTRKEDSW